MKKNGVPFWSFATLAATYLVLNIVLPIDTTTLHTYHLTFAKDPLLVFAVILPFIGVWFVAFYGYSKLRDYSNLIKRSKEGKHFAYIANGVKWLAWALPVTSIISITVKAISNSHPGFLGSGIIIHNYSLLIMALVAFVLISKGTRGLTEPLGIRPTWKGSQYLMIGFIVAGVAYCYLVLHNIPPSGAANPYHLRVRLLLLTVVAPYLYAWFAGLLSVYEISLYSKKIDGVLYKQALLFLSSGICEVIVTSAILQYISSISHHLKNLSIDYTIVVVYLLLILYLIGYILIALGASKLKRIEEV